MQKNNFSTELSKLATVPQAVDRYKISRLTLMKYAEKIGAVVRFGRSVRINIGKMDEYVDSQKTGSLKAAGIKTPYTYQEEE